MMVTGEYAYSDDLKERIAVRKATEAFLRIRFPGIVEGSTGWNRAYAAHYPKQLKRYRNGTR